MTISKLEKSTARRLPPNAGKGRKPGSRNKTTGTAKQMILAALDRAGGEVWLARQAEENPVAFMSLLARLIPTEANINADVTAHSQITEIRRTIVDPRREAGSDG